MSQETLTTLDAKIEQIEKALRENPNDETTLLAYGEANLLRGRLLEAVKCYQKLATIQPDNVECYLALGKIYFDSGLVSEAMGIVSRVLTVAPTNVEGHILLRRLQNTNGNKPADLSASLAGQLDFVPSVEDLMAERVKLESKLQELDREIMEHVRAVEQSASDPAAEFCLQMARARHARIEESLAQVARWEQHHQRLQDEQRRQEEEELRRLAEEEDRIRRAQEEAELKLREEEQRLRQQEEEVLRLQEEQRQRREEEEERVRREEEERQRQQEEAQQRLEEEQQRLRREEEDRIRREQEAAAEAARHEADRLERERLERENQAQQGRVARELAYQKLRPALEPALSALMKTKGVTSALILARDGFVVDSHAREATDVQKVANFLTAGLGVLGAQSGRLSGWQYWVLEFARGILVLQKISSDYYLVVLGQAGSNFGVLTWTIDRNRPQLEAALAQAPAVDAFS